ncbi:MAG TPA: bifunctional phosphoglucose/phosphomannose isomerase [Solirubrobacterales bacterium]|nr:bifunctional phosphoglucose/phosphomannose isomerase [Solirubrobacterales bacterium]
MLDDILDIPDHLPDALWRVESARLDPADAAGVIVCGMGGSAIGADFAIAALGDRLTKPLLTVRGYELPSWVTKDWTLLFSSYSGDTEETLVCFAAAEALGARRIVTGAGGELVEEAREAELPVIGLPGLLSAPRAAVAYTMVCVAEVAAFAGAAPRIDAEIEAAASFLAGRTEDLLARATEIAEQLEGRLPVIHGADLTIAAARRWKGQVNENAKLPAFISEIPEANHNEICGWEGSATTGARLAAVMLEDADQHPHERRRFELTAATIESTGAEVVRIETEGESRVARLLWATMLGDLVSLKLAESRGVDPLAVDALDELKAALGRL